jgi:hypothetical protein
MGLSGNLLKLPNLIVKTSQQIVKLKTTVLFIWIVTPLNINLVQSIQEKVQSDSLLAQEIMGNISQQNQIKSILISPKMQEKPGKKYIYTKLIKIKI